VTLIPGSLAGGRIRPERQLVISLAAMTALAFTVLLAGLSPDLILYTIAMMLLGFFNGLINALSQVLVLTRTTDDVRGRVGAAVSGLATAATLIGMPVGGALASVYSPRQIFIGSGATSLVVCLAVSAWALARQQPEPVIECQP
jgi:MFS family permease